MIHQSAIVSKTVEIEEDVVIGPYCVIEGEVFIEKGTEIGPMVHITGKVRIGKGCKIHTGATIGQSAQHLTKESNGKVVIEDGVTIREYASIHRGTDENETKVGKDAYLMAYAHVAHDCFVGQGAILANCATLGGHAVVEEYAFLGGLCAIHQWARVGKYAMVGGLSGVSLDIPPFCIASGQHAKLYGLNIRGLKKHGFNLDTINALKRAYRVIFRSGLTKEEAFKSLEEECIKFREVQEMVNFVKNSKRGVTRDAGIG
ncbi:MAG: acyl-ACP--UDP-N-acetylglucosamine O-acyltransferase [Aquificaceae bacterium]|nr:acyl-ACP--UDP-N-acetylglucosamine O-acyltransferase [Aquificaceae bacterium]MDW8236900.1 acyl-ACP--UDP-N-acetylglucosamine O-acyltransferase [Aquificaceae bacterium]